MLCPVILWAKLSHAQVHKNIDSLGYLPYPYVSGIWGYSDGQGGEYALIGNYDGFRVVNVTDPAHPTQLYFAPGPGNGWREIKTWSHYAYGVTETGYGLTIIDLANLPGNNLSHTIFHTTDLGPLSNAHTIWIDEKGRAFVFGATGLQGTGGCLIFDLTADPLHPVLLGAINNTYFHDGFVRGDSLWAAAMFLGSMQVHDVSLPAYTHLMGSRQTPGNFTHNIWLSDDGQYAFTTDEVPDGYITAYDVTDMNNIRELDRIQMDPAGNEIPHNVHYLNGWLPSAYYREGVVIVDAHRPQNLVVTGYYDTSYPDTGSNKFAGVWEAYPYLPSGNIIAGDRFKGLYVLRPTYVRACYLEGMITDSVTYSPLSGVFVEFSGQLAGDSLYSVIDGIYRTGTVDAGSYDITFSKPGYVSKTVNVNLQNGEVTEQNVRLRPVDFVGISEYGDFSALKIGPVPASNILRVTGLPSDVIQIRLMDGLGREVYGQTLPGTSSLLLDVSAFSPGVYSLRFDTRNRGWQQRPLIIGR